MLPGSKSPQWIANAARGVERVLPAGKITVLAGQTHLLKPKVAAPLVRELFTAETTTTRDVGERA